MQEKDKIPFFSLRNLPKLAILLVALVYLGSNFTHHNWTRDKGPDRGVIHWDIISYYGYLPATFIYGDVKLGFLTEPGFENDNKFWAYDTETGKKVIVTSMGLAYMYAPFFFMAHLLAPVFGEPRSGFNSIYQFFLVFGGLFYVLWGLHFLRIILQRFYTPLVTALTLLFVGLGTNLYNYATLDAAMSHSHNFALITLLLYLTIRWYERPGMLRAAGIGALLGLLALIRPTNILFLLVFLLWEVITWSRLRDRIIFYFRNLHYVLIMATCFLLAWIPQFLYWRMVTGEFVYNSYAPHGGAFYFSHPHLLEILFSFRAGWFLYTPVMLFALAGFLPLYMQHRNTFWGISIFLLLMIYVQASWWSWWYGGGFGARTFIDMYGVLALPMAAFTGLLLDSSRKWIRYGIPGFMGLLLMLNVFQSIQYRKGNLHSLGMTAQSYRLSFLRMKPATGYWQSISMPDPVLNRLGIYVFYHTGEDNAALKEMDREEGIFSQIVLVRGDTGLMKEIGRYSKRESVSLDQAIRMVAERMYEQKTN